VVCGGATHPEAKEPSFVLMQRPMSSVSECIIGGIVVVVVVVVELYMLPSAEVQG